MNDHFFPYAALGLAALALALLSFAFGSFFRGSAGRAAGGESPPEPNPHYQPAQAARDATPIVVPDAEWRKRLPAEQYRVTRAKGTEPPFTGRFVHPGATGTYHCADCGNPLFASETQFDSHCGWPAFSAAADAARIRENADTSHGMVRTEVTCARCGAHLGHVFDDGPAPTGQRYCINSVALRLEAGEKAGTESSAKDADGASRQQAYFAAGCFWGVEAAFRKIPGVLDTAVGYAGGSSENPTYEQVCTGRTGHAETVCVTFDPSRVSYGALLAAFWRLHDPTQVDRQGPDRGAQYRSAIFCATADQEKEAAASRDELQKTLPERIATQILPAPKFWPAEEYHQRYYEKRGGGACPR